MEPTLLIVGGAADPNLALLLTAAKQLDIRCIPVLTEVGRSPAICWQLSADTLTVNQVQVKPAAAFVRYDVFTKSGKDDFYRAKAWHTTIEGWLVEHSEVRLLNRGYLAHYTNKLQVLRMAARFGLPIPETTVTNDARFLWDFQQQHDAVAKPVPGGGYCRELDQLLPQLPHGQKAAPAPAIVQQKVPGENIRVYFIEDEAFCYKILSDSLDYRASERVDIEPFNGVPTSYLIRLQELMAEMHLQWAAVDLIKSSASGELVFLEINSNPMFAAFDRASEGKLSRRLVRSLCPLPKTNRPG
jgi:hypothetical protein